MVSCLKNCCKGRQREQDGKRTQSHSSSGKHIETKVSHHMLFWLWVSRSIFEIWKKNRSLFLKRYLRVPKGRKSIISPWKVVKNVVLLCLKYLPSRSRFLHSLYNLDPWELLVKAENTNHFTQAWKQFGDHHHCTSTRFLSPCQLTLMVFCCCCCCFISLLHHFPGVHPFLSRAWMLSMCLTCANYILNAWRTGTLSHVMVLLM